MADTKTSTSSSWLNNNSLDISKGEALSFGAQGVSTVLNAFSSYQTAKHNYTLTVQTANDLLEQTEKQVKQLNMEYYQNAETNRAYISGQSGLESTSYSDVMRMNLSEKEDTVTDMRTYAQKQAQTMIEEARRAKKQAKKAKSGALLGGILGAGVGAMFGGPAGASVGMSIGSSLGQSSSQL